jgi:hypothetical protein
VASQKKYYKLSLHTIDGKLDETIWQSTPEATNFIMFQPDNGRQFPKIKKTIVKVIYDIDALSPLYDDETDKIRKEISPDSFGISDVFCFINGFNDGRKISSLIHC